MRVVQSLLVAVVLSACGLLVWKGTQLLTRHHPPPAPPAGASGEGASGRPAAVTGPAVPEPVATAVDTAPAQSGEGISAKNSEAIDRLEAGDFERAIALFEQCLAAQPDEEVFRSNLAAAMARYALALHESETGDDRARARELLARSLELNPGQESLAQLLARWKESARAEEGFDSYGSERFELVFDGFRPDMADGIPQVLEKLEMVYLEYGEQFGFFPVEEGRERIRVVFYERKQFDRVTGLGHWAGGVFDGTVRLPVEDLRRERRRVDTVLRHELAHAFVLEAGGQRVPGWLNEGLAQWLEESSPGRRVTQVDGASARLRDWLRDEQELFPIERLQGSLAKWDDAEQIQLAYAQSLAVVDHVTRQYGERRLFEMVAACKAGESAEENFQRQVGVGIDVVLTDLARELR